MRLKSMHQDNISEGMIDKIQAGLEYYPKEYGAIVRDAKSLGVPIFQKSPKAAKWWGDLFSKLGVQEGDRVGLLRDIYSEYSHLMGDLQDKMQGETKVSDDKIYAVKQALSKLHQSGNKKPSIDEITKEINNISKSRWSSKTVKDVLSVLGASSGGKEPIGEGVIDNIRDFAAGALDYLDPSKHDKLRIKSLTANTNVRIAKKALKYIEKQFKSGKLKRDTPPWIEKLKQKEDNEKGEEEKRKPPIINKKKNKKENITQSGL